jgi:hypothetical protein
MPIPDAPEGPPAPGAVVVAQLHQLHDELRQQIESLDTHGLCWSPAEGVNSVATLVVHLLGSEAEAVATVAGLAVERDRPAEFVPRPVDHVELRALLDRADALLVELAPRLCGERLGAPCALPTLPEDEERPGLTWLTGNLAHAREHLGQILLTAQLYREARARAV